MFVCFLLSLKEKLLFPCVCVFECMHASPWCVSGQSVHVALQSCVCVCARVCYMRDYVQEQPLLGKLLVIICVYGSPLCALFTRPPCIIVLMHDHPFLSFNGLCAKVYVCVCVK